MKVMKFGGTSVGTYDGLKNVIEIVGSCCSQQSKVCVVCSAFTGVTDKLLKISELASQKDSVYESELKNLIELHNKFIADFINNPTDSFWNKINDDFKSLTDTLKGVFLIGELSLRTKDFVVSFGERLSCKIITEILLSKGADVEFIDAREIIKTDSDFGNAKIDYESTNKNIIKLFESNDKTKIITGFISSNEKGETTTIGRGGSDLTASVIGAALDAEEIEIWTDVDGILTADPRKIKNPIPLKAVTYEEAIEMSYFGAKVIYSPTIVPALEKNIKIRIKNTFNPSFKGTVIIPREKGINFTFKSISSVPNVSIIRVLAKSYIQQKGIEYKILSKLGENGINILLISQASAQKATCITVSTKDSEKALEVVNAALEIELQKNEIEKITIENDLALIAIVAEDIIKTPGILGRVFQALGKNGINVDGVVSGSSETNISVIISGKDEKKAISVLHDALFVSELNVINLFLLGPGLVGKALLNVLATRAQKLKEERKVQLRLAGIANSKKMLFNSNGIEIETVLDELASSEEISDMNSFIDGMVKMNLSNSIFLDCSGIKQAVDFYEKILGSSISIVTPSKIANSMDYDFYQKLRKLSYQHNTNFRYSANVGAGLPIINTLKDLVISGDKINCIQGVLSGTLSYLFNRFNHTNKSFSELVKEAKELGYTEPDPRDDLNGLDVARKILILARELETKINLSDVQVENLIPEALRGLESSDEFMNKLPEYDEYYQGIKDGALKENKRLCYIAKFENGKATVKLEAVDESHPFYNLESNDAILSLSTENYSNKPLVIRGAGAGAKLTAIGVFSDILRVVDFLK